MMTRLSKHAFFRFYALELTNFSTIARLFALLISIAVTSPAPGLSLVCAELFQTKSAVAQEAHLANKKIAEDPLKFYSDVQARFRQTKSKSLDFAMPEYVPMIRLADEKLDKVIEYFTAKKRFDIVRGLSHISAEAKKLISQNAPYARTISFFQVYSDGITIHDLFVRDLKHSDGTNVDATYVADLLRTIDQQLQHAKLRDIYGVQDFDTLVTEGPHAVLVPFFGDQPLKDFIISKRAPVYFVGLVDRLTRAHGSLDFVPNDFFRHDLFHTRLLLESDVESLGFLQRYKARMHSMGMIADAQLPASRPPTKAALRKRNRIISNVVNRIEIEKDPVLKRALKIAAFHIFHETQTAPESLAEVDKENNTAIIISDLDDNWYGRKDQLGPDPKQIIMRAISILADLN